MASNSIHVSIPQKATYVATDCVQPLSQVRPFDITSCYKDLATTSSRLSHSGPSLRPRSSAVLPHLFETSRFSRIRTNWREHARSWKCGSSRVFEGGGAGWGGGGAVA